MEKNGADSGHRGKYRHAAADVCNGFRGDPFGLYRTERAAKRPLAARRKTQKAVPYPTTNGDKALGHGRSADGAAAPELEAARGPVVDCAGVVRRVEYKDIIEDVKITNRRGNERVRITERLKRPDLAKRAALRRRTTTGEEEVTMRELTDWKSPGRFVRTFETIHH